MNNYINIQLVKKEKIRNPNIDFIRIAGMLTIIIHHILVHGEALFKYKHYSLVNILYVLSMWHVSSFGIVSGIVGNKTHKFSNLLYLWFMTEFYLILFYIIYNKQTKFLKNKAFITYLFPVIHKKYWYFTCYFGIYPFLPFINSGISKLPQIVLKKISYFMIGIFFIWSSLYSDVFSQNSGLSPFSLLIFYIFGAYISKYIFYQKNQIIYKIIICFICLFIFITISLITYWINIKKLFPKINPNIKNLFQIRVNSVPMLLQVFSFIIFVAQINFNKYISKIITFIGPLVFDIYLIHENPFIRIIFIKKYFTQYSNRLKLFYVCILIFKGALYIFCISLFIAYIRSIIFRTLRIRIISIKFELLITKLLYYFI